MDYHCWLHFVSEEKLQLAVQGHGTRIHSQIYWMPKSLLISIILYYHLKLHFSAFLKL